MMTIELFVSDDSIPATRLRELSTRVLDALTAGHDAPESTLARARELTHVVVHRPQIWGTGGPDVGRTPRYLVRVVVPGTWNIDGFAGHVIPAITRAIEEAEGNPSRLHRDPHCIVQVIGLREGSFGVRGEVTSSADITRIITEEFRTSAGAVVGGAIDPVCGMTVDPDTAQFRLAHDGVDYVFCAAVCRKVFAEDRGLTV